MRWTAFLKSYVRLVSRPRPSKCDERVSLTTRTASLTDSQISTRASSTGSSAASATSSIPTTTSPLTSTSCVVDVDDSRSAASGYSSASESTATESFALTSSSPLIRRARDRIRRPNVNAERSYGESFRSDLSTGSSPFSPANLISPTDRSRFLDPTCELTTQNEENFVRLRRSRSSVWNSSFPENTIVVYTDASYVQRMQHSGIGIYLGPNHELNRSHRVRGPIQDNNFAELLAVVVALRNLRRWDGLKSQAVIVRTDNLSVIHAVESGAGAFPEMTAKLVRLADEFPRGVQFQHVFAHEGDPGNEMADTLAGLATAKRSRSADPTMLRRKPRSATRENAHRRSQSNEPTFIRSHSAHAGRRRLGRSGSDRSGRHSNRGRGGKRGPQDGNGGEPGQFLPL